MSVLGTSAFTLPSGRGAGKSGPRPLPHLGLAPPQLRRPQGHGLANGMAATVRRRSTLVEIQAEAIRHIGGYLIPLEVFERMAQRP